MKKIFFSGMMMLGAVLSGFDADFATGFLPRELSQDGNPSGVWKCENGTVRNTNSKPGMPALKYAFPNPVTSFKFTLRLKRAEKKLAGDQHFGLLLASPDSNAMLYCRNNQFALWNQKKNTHAAIGRTFRAPGEDHWLLLEFTMKGTHLEIKADGVVVAESDDFCTSVRTISIYAYNNQLEIGEYKIESDQAAPAPAPAKAAESAKPSESGNLALNPSFEQSTLPPLPDYWGVPHWGISEAKWVLQYQEWQRCFRLVDDAYHGKKAIRIENTSDKPVDSPLVLSSCNFGMKCNRKYVFSAYMKADRPGVKVQMFGGRIHYPCSATEGDVFTLTTEYKRYHVVYYREDPSLYGDMLRIAMLNKGAICVDAVQLEEGETLHPFQMPAEQRKLTVHEGNAEKMLYDVPHLKLTEKPAHVVMRSLQGKPVQETSTADVSVTPDGIKLSVHVVESKKIACKYKERDSFVWRDPSVELFLDPRLSRGSYYHLVFNRNGVRHDDKDGDSRWNGNWSVRTSDAPDGWMADVFLPFADFEVGTAVHGDWGFNLARTNKVNGEDSCWAPTFGSFHSPLRFGQLHFSPALLTPFRLSVKSASLSSTGLSVKFASASDRKLQGVLAVRDLKGALLGQKQVTLQPGSEQELFFPLAGVHTGKLNRAQFTFTAGKRVLYNAVQALPRSVPLQLIPRYDYCSSDKEFPVRLLLAGIAPKSKIAVTVTDPAGKTVWEKTFAPETGKLDFNIPVETLADGLYNVSAQLAGGKISAKASFRKQPPVATELRIDRFRRITTLNGKPYLPMGIWWEGAITPDLIRFLKKSGFNVLPGAGAEQFIEHPELLRAAEECGMLLIPDVHARSGKLKEFIPYFAKAKSVIAYYGFDEVFTIDWGKKNHGKVMADIEESRKLDPARPTFICENIFGMNFLREKQLYFPGEIAFIDVYTYPPNANPTEVDRAAQDLVSVADEGNRPAWINLYLSGYAFHAPRDLRPEEYAQQFYISLIDGIRGIFYFASMPKAESSFRQVRQNFAEGEQLLPVLADGEPDESVSCSAQEIRWTSFHYQGKTWILAVNLTEKPVQASFSVPQIKGGTVRFENRRVTAADGKITDVFAPMARHVYELE